MIPSQALQQHFLLLSRLPEILSKQYFLLLPTKTFSFEVLQPALLSRKPQEMPQGQPHLLQRIRWQGNLKGLLRLALKPEPFLFGVWQETRLQHPSQERL